MYYDKIRHRNNQVLAATGLTTVEFDALLTTFKYHWDEYYSHFTLEGKVRQRGTEDHGGIDGEAGGGICGELGLRQLCGEAQRPAGGGTK